VKEWVWWAEKQWIVHQMYLLTVGDFTVGDSLFWKINGVSIANENYILEQLWAIREGLATPPEKE
jgi:hypothetical protein